MNRNKQEKRKKEILRLRREASEIWDAQRNQNWVEYDEPIPHGWIAEYVLRADIERSPQAKIYQEVLNACSKSCWSRRKDFKYKEYKSKKWQVLKPGLSNIKASEYDKLSDKAKNYFCLSYNPYGYRVEYVCHLERWKLDIKKTRKYKTHYQEHDELLAQRDAEIDAQIWGKYYGEAWGGWRYGVEREWYKYQNKKDKGKAKRNLRKIIVGYNDVGCDVDYWNYEYDGYELDNFPTGKFELAWYYD